MFLININCDHRFQVRLGIFFSFDLGTWRFWSLVVNVFVRRLGLYWVCLGLIIVNFLIELLLLNAVRPWDYFVKLFVYIIFLFLYHLHFLLNFIDVLSLYSQLCIFYNFHTFLFHLVWYAVFSHFEESSFVSETVFLITFPVVMIVKLFDLYVSVFIFKFWKLLLLKILKIEKDRLDVNRGS